MIGGNALGWAYPGALFPSFGTSNTDSQSGTVTWSGTGVDARQHTDSQSGTISWSGAGAESDTESEVGTGTLTLTGTALETAHYGDSQSGTIVWSGTWSTVTPTTVTVTDVGGNRLFHRPASIPVGPPVHALGGCATVYVVAHKPRLRINLTTVPATVRARAHTAKPSFLLTIDQSNVMMIPRVEHGVPVVMFRADRDPANHDLERSLEELLLLLEA